MTNVRAWRRLWRERGWVPFGLLAVTVLATLYGVNEMLAMHMNLRDAAEMKALLRARAQVRSDYLPQLEQTFAAERAAAGGIAARLVPAEEGLPNAASERFSTIMRDWYAAQGARQAAVLNVQRRDENGLVYLRAEIDAPMKIDQLAALLQGKMAAPLALRLVDATIEANDMRTPTGLRTRMTWEGLAGPPRPVAKDSGNDEKKPAKTGQRSVERGGPEPMRRDEKRK